MVNELKTPCYIIDTKSFTDNIKVFSESFRKFWKGSLLFGYSVKTNHFPYLLKVSRENGMYAETVSDDELYLAINSGYETGRIIYNGPQKSRENILQMLKSDGYINLDNFSDIDYIESSDIPSGDIHANIGIRVNMDLDSLCPGQTTSGRAVSRFGFCLENGELALAIKKLHDLGLPVSGLHMHYSSLTRSRDIFKSLSETAADVIGRYDLASEISYINMGGGFFYGSNRFASGKPSPDEYAEVITSPLKKIVDEEKCTLILEPGAALIASAADYCTRIINERNIRGTKILTTDGSDLHINPLRAKRSPVYSVIYDGKAERTCHEKQIICGASCMENDRIMTLENDKELFPGDLIVVHFAGAYTMGFNNCFINDPPAVYLKKDREYELLRDKDRDLMDRV